MTEKFIIKETAKLALWDCSSLKNLYKNLAIELEIENLITYPISAKSVIIWDEGNDQTSPVKLLNIIWTITINEILRLKKSDTKPEVKKTSFKNKRWCNYIHKWVSKEKYFTRDWEITSELVSGVTRFSWLKAGE